MEIEELKNFSIMFNGINEDMHLIASEISKNKDKFFCDIYSKYEIDDKFIYIFNAFTDCHGTVEELDYSIPFELYLKWKNGEKINWKLEDI